MGVHELLREPYKVGRARPSSVVEDRYLYIPSSNSSQLATMPRQGSFVAAGLALLMATATHALPFSFGLVARDPPKALPQRATADDLK